MAASLGCEPCKDGFVKATQLVLTYPKNINLALRFRNSGSRENRFRSTSTYLIEYWNQYIFGTTECSARSEKLIRDWYNKYNGQNIKDFKDQYPIQKDNGMKDTVSLAEKHYLWFEQVAINKTPTFFINGWQLPKQYKIEDLIALIPALTKYFERRLPQVEQH